MNIIGATEDFIKQTMVGRVEWLGRALNGRQRQADQKKRETGRQERERERGRGREIT